MGDKQLFIFDIDSALDKLEDDLISNEIITPQSQQKIYNDEEISKRLSDKAIGDVAENNENDVNELSSKEPLSESIGDSKFLKTLASPKKF